MNDGDMHFMIRETHLARKLEAGSGEPLTLDLPDHVSFISYFIFGVNSKNEINYYFSMT
jgi:hypothetical protein